MELSSSCRVTRALRDAGIMEPESCSILLKALEETKCENFQKRLIAISRLSVCIEYLYEGGHTQLLVNLVVFLLERGVAKWIAAAMREISAGEWVLMLPEKDISVSSKSNSSIFLNNALLCSRLLHRLAADQRCVTAILKDFPDLARVAKAIFLTKLPTDRRIQRPADLEKRVKWSMLAILDPVIGLSPRFRKQLAEDTFFWQEVLRHAKKVRNEAQREEVYIRYVTIIYNVVREGMANLLALRVDLLEFLGTILARSENRDQIELATRMLVVLLPLAEQQFFGSSNLTAAGLSYPLDSSLLAMLSMGESLDESIRVLARAAAEEYWKEDTNRLEEAELDALFKTRIQNDERARNRAVELSCIFSAASKEQVIRVSHLELKRPMSEEGSDSENVLSTKLSPAFAIKVRLECRKCSRAGCDSLETKAGTFPVCGRCKMAVYCSKDCQKRAWKEGHKKLCH